MMALRSGLPLPVVNPKLLVDEVEEDGYLSIGGHRSSGEAGQDPGPGRLG